MNMQQFSAGLVIAALPVVFLLSLDWSSSLNPVGIAFSCLWALLISAAAHASLVDPSVYSAHDDVKFCQFCHTNVSSDARHCRRCDKCVPGFDHHCMWLNTCVGHRNYWSFFMAMMCCWGMCCLVLVYASFTLAGQLSAYAIACICMTALACYFLTDLLCFHLYLNFKRITTVKFILERRKAAVNEYLPWWWCYTQRR